MNPLDHPEEILATTIEFKEMKKNLYEYAAQKCTDEAGIETFSFLRDRECEQMAILGKGRTAQPEKTSCSFPYLPPWDWKKVESIRSAIFQDTRRHRPGAEDVIALENSLAIEQACLRFFIYALKEAVEPREREFLNRMIWESKERMALLSDLGLQFAVSGRSAPAPCEIGITS